MSLKIEEKFYSKISKDELLEATPSCHIRAMYQSSIILDTELGNRYKYYDIASLTKIVFTTSRFIELIQAGKCNLDDDVSLFFKIDLGRKLSIRQLLTHSAGHRWWAPLYEELLGSPSDSIDFLVQWEKLEKILSLENANESPAKYVYSDIDFLFLGLLLIKIASKNLEEQWSEFAEMYELKDSFFAVNNKFPFDIDLVAPTEYSDWRSSLMQGQVHDENTFSLGGVSSHAGLFSTMNDLSHWVSLVNSSRQASGPFDALVLNDFIKRQTPTEKGDWGLGFMKPSPGTASCGKYFSDKSFGHTGFTGTSIWVDPESDLSVIILSNRVHPSRENRKFVGLRSKIHNAIFESVKESNE